MSDEKMAYVGFCHQCHGAYMMVVDNPERQREVMAEVAKVEAAGDSIEHLTVSAARATWAALTCECESVEDLEQPSPEQERAAELAKLAAWNAGLPRKVTA